MLVGRYGLPIPFRTPMMGVAGDIIKVEKKENPTPEDIATLLQIVEDRIVEVFDNHKAAYGWENVKLAVI